MFVKYFPAGDKGVILLNTRNPARKVHATVGSYGFGQMGLEEAVTLLLNASDAGDISDESAKSGKINYWLNFRNVHPMGRHKIGSQLSKIPCSSHDDLPRLLQCSNLYSR